MRFILSMFKRLTFQQPHDDNARAGRDNDSQQPISGYAAMCKLH